MVNSKHASNEFNYFLCENLFCNFTNKYEKNSLSNIKYHIAFKIGPSMLDVRAKCHGAPVTKCVTDVSIQ